MVDLPRACESGSLSGSRGEEPSGITVPSRELRLLIQGLHSWCGPALGGGIRGSLGILSGKPGSGKSLVMGVLDAALKTLGIRGYWAACFREMLPLEPIRTLLDSILREILSSGPNGGDRPSPFEYRSIRPYVPQLRSLLPRLPWPEPARPFPSLGMELDRIRTCDVLAQTFADVASAAPLVLMIEDLHRIDPISRDILGALLRIVHLRASRPNPPRLLLVASLQQGEGEGLESILDPRFLAFEVEVRGYSREDVRDCVEAARVDLPLTLRESLHRATEGNPFQVRFYLNGLREGGRKHFLPEVPGDPGRAGEAFERALLSRFSDLEPREKDALCLLAVLRRPQPLEFISRILVQAFHSTRGGLLGIFGGSSEEKGPEEVLAGLLAGGWVRRTSMADGGPAWTIAGNPMADIIEDSLSTEKVARLHRAIAEGLLERMGCDSGTGLPRICLTPWSWIFHHLARSMGHPRLAEIGCSAAKEMESIGSMVQAIEVYERILEDLDSASDGSLWFKVAEKLVSQLEAAQAHGEAIEILRRLHSVRGEGLDPEARAGMLRRIGELHGKLGERKEEMECYSQALAGLPEGRESLERLKIYALLARVSIERGDISESLRYLQESLKLPKGSDPLRNDEYLEIFELAEEVSYRRGEYVEAISFEDRIFGLCQEAGDDCGMIRAASHLGHLHFLRGDCAASRHWHLLALQRAEQSSSRYLKARCLRHLGQLHRVSGEIPEALERLSESRDLFTELACEEVAADLQKSLIHLHLSACDFSMAQKAFADFAARSPLRLEDREAGAFPLEDSGCAQGSEGIETCRKVLLGEKVEGNQVAGRVQGGIFSELLLDDGKLSEAMSLCEDSLKSPEVTGNPVFLARILQRQGRLHRILGDRKKALFFYEKSLNSLGTVPEKALVGMAYIEVGAISLVQGDAGKAYDYILRGLRLFLDLKDDRGFTLAMLRLSEFFKEVGLHKVAADIAEGVAELCARAELGRWEVQAHCLRGAIASESGDFGESERRFKRARSLIEAMGLTLDNVRLRLEEGWDLYRRKNYAEALGMAREGIEIARNLGLEDTLDDFLFLLGAVESTLANKKKNFLRALEILNKALLGAQSRTRPFAEAQIHNAIAVIYEERGKDELSQECRSRSRAIYDLILSRLPKPMREAFESAYGLHVLNGAAIVAG